MTRRLEMKPTVEELGDGQRIRHPAFGAITVSRQNGGHFALHGSDFRHDRTICLEVHEADYERKLANDWHHHYGLPIISVRMSEAQWASFVSSFNIGPGTPCTIEYAGGKEYPRIEPLEARAKTFKDEMAKTLASAKDRLQEALEALEKAIQSKKVTDIRSASSAVNAALGAVTSGAPFIEDQFAEHVETTVEAAKAEAHAYMQHQILIDAGRMQKAIPHMTAEGFDEFRKEGEEWKS